MTTLELITDIEPPDQIFYLNFQFAMKAFPFNSLHFLFFVRYGHCPNRARNSLLNHLFNNTNWTGNFHFSDHNTRFPLLPSLADLGGRLGSHPGHALFHHRHFVRKAWHSARTWPSSVVSARFLFLIESVSYPILHYSSANITCSCDRGRSCCLYYCVAWGAACAA